jgi:CRP-like cAMP-binding protein
MDRDSQATLSTGWIARMPPELRREILEGGRLRTFPDGAMIYAFEQEGTCLWGVVSGHVRFLVTMNEQDPRFAHCAGPGFWFGEIPVILGGTRAMQAMVFGETKLCAVDVNLIASLAHRDPAVWRWVAALSVMNEMTAIGAADDLMVRDSRKRLIAVLLRLAGHRNAFQGAAPIATLPLTQVELAEASSLSRSSATMILGALSRKGLIRTDYRTIVILDPEALKAMLAE